MNNFTELAPICISTYSRLEHLKQTINALQQNTLANKSELYIFSDGAKTGDEQKVSDIRKYIHTITGFKKINIIERTTNNRILNNRGGMKMVLEKYGKIIFLEEDIVTAPGFLQFMNDALFFYRNNHSILTITGYCPPIEIPSSYNNDFFILQRPNMWGFATWREKFDPFGFNIYQHGIKEFLHNKKEKKKLMQNGQDIYDMLRLEVAESIDALDVKTMYYEYKYNMFTIYPVRSLVQNIGHDGTGLHCGDTTIFHHDSLWLKQNNFQFSEKLTVNEEIRKANYIFRKRQSGGLRAKLAKLSKLFYIYPILKKLKEQI